MGDAPELSGRLGLDEAGRKARLAWVGYAAADEERAQKLKAALDSRRNDVADRFLTRLLKLPEILLLVGDSARMMALRTAVSDQLGALGVGVGGAVYVEARLRTGVQLARMGVPLTLCASLIAQLEAVTTEILLEEAVPAAEREKLNATLRKILLFDLSLWMEGARVDQAPIATAPATAAPAPAPARGGPPPIPTAARSAAPKILDEAGLRAALDEALQKAEQEGRGLSIAMASLDDLGRGAPRDLAGEIVDHVARRLAATLRAQDAIGRQDDGRLVILLGDVTTRAAVAAAERFRALVATQPIETADGGSRFVTISQGVVSWRPGLGGRALLDRAAEALGSAQRSGRDRVASASS